MIYRVTTAKTAEQVSPRDHPSKETQKNKAKTIDITNSVRILDKNPKFLMAKQTMNQEQANLKMVRNVCSIFT